MSKRYDIPSKIKTTSNHTINVDEFLSQGGQGAVFTTKDKNMLVKCLVNETEIIKDKKVYETYKDKIEDIIVIDFPEDINACRPIGLLEEPYCGYFMKFLSETKPISNLLDMTPETMKNDFGYKKRLEVLVELSRTFLRLHSKNIVYCDISHNNIFYGEEDGYNKVWLIDCDNMFDSDENRRGAYTPGYEAPEVVTNGYCTTYSDCFSFAVLVLKMLVGIQAFIQEESDDWDSEPSFQYYKDYKGGQLYNVITTYLPIELLNMIDSTLQSKKPEERPSMSEWFNLLSNMLLRVIKCDCGLYILNKKKCPVCGNDIKINKYAIIYNDKKKLHVHKKVIINDNTSIKNIDIDTIKTNTFPKEYINFSLDGDKLIVNIVEEIVGSAYLNGTKKEVTVIYNLYPGEELILLLKDPRNQAVKVVNI